jgi:hypothetical protein
MPELCPLAASDHNYPYVRIDRSTAAQRGAWPLWPGPDDRACLPSPDGTPASSGSRTARRARSPWHPTVRGSRSCAPPPRTGQRVLGTRPRRRPGDGWRRTREPFSAVRRSISPRRSARRERSREGVAGYATDTPLGVGVFRLVRAAFRGRATGRYGTRTPRRGTGDRPAPLPRRMPCRLRRLRRPGRPAYRRRRGRGAMDARRGGVGAGLLRPGRVHRGRGDGALAGLLVGAGVRPTTEPPKTRGHCRTVSFTTQGSSPGCLHRTPSAEGRSAACTTMLADVQARASHGLATRPYESHYGERCPAAPERHPQNNNAPIEGNEVEVLGLVGTLTW